MLQAALQDTEAQLLQLQRETEAQACQLEARTHEVQMLQELSAEQQAAVASNTKQSQQSEQRLTQDVAKLQVIDALYDDVILQDVPCRDARVSVEFSLLLQHSMTSHADQQHDGVPCLGSTASKISRVLGLVTGCAVSRQMPGPLLPNLPWSPVSFWAPLLPTPSGQSSRYNVWAADALLYAG